MNYFFITKMKITESAKSWLLSNIMGCHSEKWVMACNTLLDYRIALKTKTETEMPWSSAYRNETLQIVKKEEIGENRLQIRE